MDRFEKRTLKIGTKIPNMAQIPWWYVYGVKPWGRQTRKICVLLKPNPPRIKFTHAFSNISIAFIDTTVKADTDNSLHTTLYQKPTDTHLYVHYTSHHEPSKSRGLYGEYIRLRCINSSQDTAGKGDIPLKCSLSTTKELQSSIMMTT